MRCGLRPRLDNPDSVNRFDDRNAVTFADLCDAPPQLCALIHRLLGKNPTRRPNANEVRHTARAISLDLAAGAYAEMEISEPRVSMPDGDFDIDVEPVQMRRWPDMMPSDEVVVVDPETLESGTTEMHAVVKPRWTPPFARTIVPKAARDQIAGEIVCAPSRGR